MWPKTSATLTAASLLIVRGSVTGRTTCYGTTTEMEGEQNVDKLSKERSAKLVKTRAYALWLRSRDAST
jgi:hypothetical protein